MPTIEDYKDFLAVLRKQTGLEALAPDDTGLVSLRVQDEYNLNLQFVKPSGKILCFVEVAELANDVRNIASHGRENLAKFRGDLARNIAETLRGLDPSKLDARYFRSVFVWAIRKAAEPFSMRALAQRFADGSDHQDFANADFYAAFS